MNLGKNCIHSSVGPLLIYYTTHVNTINSLDVILESVKQLGGNRGMPRLPRGMSWKREGGGPILRHYENIR